MRLIFLFILWLIGMYQIIAGISGVAFLIIGIVWLRWEIRQYRKNFGNAIFDNIVDLLCGPGPRFIFAGLAILWGLGLIVSAIFAP
jgi:hypothetical protein